MNYEYNVSKLQNTTKLKTYAVEDNKNVGLCLISVTDNIWTISGWFVDKEYQGKGIGTSLLQGSLKYLCENFGEPSKIEYIWNGANEYVLDWLTKNFSPVSKCPIAVQKTQADDDWSSHIYTLDKDKVLRYFDIEDIIEEDIDII